MKLGALRLPAPAPGSVAGSRPATVAGGGLLTGRAVRCCGNYQEEKAKKLRAKMSVLSGGALRLFSDLEKSLKKDLEKPW